MRVEGGTHDHLYPRTSHRTQKPTNSRKDPYSNHRTSHVILTLNCGLLNCTGHGSVLPQKLVWSVQITECEHETIFKSNLPSSNLGNLHTPQPRLSHEHSTLPIGSRASLPPLHGPAGTQARLASHLDLWHQLLITGRRFPLSTRRARSTPRDMCRIKLTGCQPYPIGTAPKANRTLLGPQS